LETSHPYFSIIIPTFNRASLLLNGVTSILGQKGVPFEVIIVDDGSQDNTGFLIREIQDERVKYIKTPNRERGAARNSGLLIAKGEYVNYFDSDDIFNPHLADLHRFIEDNNHPAVVYGLIENVTENGHSVDVVRPAFQGFKESLLFNNFLACGSVFIKREFAFKFLFSEDRRLSGTEDWELWLRLYSVYDFVQFPFIVFKQRLHPNRSLSQVSADRTTEREIVFIEHIRKSHQLLSHRFSAFELNALIADRYTLIALSHCESGSKRNAARYLMNAIKISLWVIKRKRFWAVLKNLIFDGL
jgi:glycosyltransferase involved in cell wall biosynthesis